MRTLRSAQLLFTDAKVAKSCLEKHTRPSPSQDLSSGIQHTERTHLYRSPPAGPLRPKGCQSCVDRCRDGTTNDNVSTSSPCEGPTPCHHAWGGHQRMAGAVADSRATPTGIPCPPEPSGWEVPTIHPGHFQLSLAHLCHGHSTPHRSSPAMRAQRKATRASLGLGSMLGDANLKENKV